MSMRSLLLLISDIGGGVGGYLMCQRVRRQRFGWQSVVMVSIGKIKNLGGGYVVSLPDIYVSIP